MLMRIIFISLSALLLVSCKLHVNISGLESELIIIEENTGETLTLSAGDELVAFDKSFTAIDYFKVTIDKSSGQNCHLIYKSGRFTTPYTEIEVNCQPITDSNSCTVESEPSPICVRIDDNLDCLPNGPCLGSIYHTFKHECEASASELNPIQIGLTQCTLIENTRSTLDTPAKFEDDIVVDPAITIISATFDGDIVRVIFDHTKYCYSPSYSLNVNRFKPGATEVEWSIQYSRTCETLSSLEQSIKFDLMPVREWFYQQNNLTNGSVELPGIGTYTF